MNMMTRWIAARACLALLPFTGTATGDDYQVCGLYRGEDPSGHTAWNNGHRGQCGLAHDDSRWYITEGPTPDGDDHARIWSVPVGTNLAFTFPHPVGVFFIDVNETIGLPLADPESYVMGDPVVYRYVGVDYLLVPFHLSGTAGPGYLAVFEAATLRFIDITPPLTNLPRVFSVAVDPEGHIYFAGNGFGGFLSLWKQSMNWANVHNNEEFSAPSPLEIISLRKETGDPIEHYAEVVGHEFTTDGRFLYLLSSNTSQIDVFDTSTWRRVLRSTSDGPFNFDLNPGDRAAGLTLWDLDANASPHPGQLHVAVLQRDEFSSDDVLLKHYTNVIRVQHGAPPPGYGTPDDPFPTVTAAANWIWPPGCEIRIAAGAYDEAITIPRRVRLTSDGGTVRIGE